MFPSSQSSSSGKNAAFRWRPSKSWTGTLKNVAGFLNDRVYAVNNSKIFAGLIIILLNVSSKFVTIKLSKSMESYFRNTFSRDALIFAMAWMGTRDIYVALFMTVLFILCMNYFFNEESAFCCLPEHFTDYHLALNETKLSSETPISKEELKHAKKVIEEAEKQGVTDDEE